jgi:predicted DNA-binding transcriptional regulator YafY
MGEKGKVQIILLRILGWIMLITSLVTIISMVLDDGDFFAYVFFIILAFTGLCLTGYKKTRVLPQEARSSETSKEHPGSSKATISSKKPKTPARPKPVQGKVKPIWEGKVYYLEYQAEDGSISERNIEINKIENGGRPRNSYIHAFCFQSLAMRTFRFDRIIGLYEDDGREIENPFYYLTKNSNRPARVDAATLAAEALNDDT